MLGKGLRFVLELRLVDRDTPRQVSAPHLRRRVQRCPSVPHRRRPIETKRCRGADPPVVESPAPPDVPDDDRCDEAA